MALDFYTFSYFILTDTVQQAHHDQTPVQSVPVIREVTIFSDEEGTTYSLHCHLDREDESEDTVTEVQESPLSRPGWNGLSLHGCNPQLRRFFTWRHLPRVMQLPAIRTNKKGYNKT